MKCMYYLAPSLVSTQQISDDLRELGIDEWFLHVISRDEAGLKRLHIHSSNWFETLDLIREGFIGANLGFVAGTLLAGALMFFKPFGPETPGVAFFFAVLVPTLFGAWVGGLLGMDKENSKLRRFHDDIDAGKYLILIYVKKGMGDAVKDMMQSNHPEASHEATDRHFVNPFSRLRRRKAGTQTKQAFE